MMGELKNGIICVFWVDFYKDHADRKLKGFDEIWFYYNTGHFHKLYRKLLHESEIRKQDNALYSSE